MISKTNKQIGFAILYAVLMVSIVLTISLTLLDISYKQLILSSINKESRTAYYAAVSALNCVMFWDVRARDPLSGPNFDTYYRPFGDFNYSFIPPSFTPAIAANQLIRCAQDSSPGNNITVSSSGRVSTFTVNFINGSYAFVTVIKGDGINGAASGHTLFQVDGYNTTLINSRRVQRSIDTTI